MEAAKIFGGKYFQFDKRTNTHLNHALPKYSTKLKQVLDVTDKASKFILAHKLDNEQHKKWENPRSSLKQCDKYI